MKLTTKSEYALLALLHLARQETNTYTRLDQIRTKYSISAKYLQQLFYILKANHYVKTKRGSLGGYILAKKPQDITIAEILRLMDGPLAPIDSASTYFYSPTVLEQEKKLHHIFKEIRDFSSKLLESHTIKDFI